MSDVKGDQTAPAARVLEVFSQVFGRKAVVNLAKALKVAPSTIYRWTYIGKGSNGLIPAKYHRPILEFAEIMGVPLKAEDLV